MWHHLLAGSLLAFVVSSSGTAIALVAVYPQPAVFETLAEVVEYTRRPFHRGSGRRELLPQMLSAIA